MSKLIIAIDGPAASGKSSVSKVVAKKLGLSYIDTGAMYRCMTLFTLQNGISPDDEKSISELLPSCNIIFDGPKCIMNGVDVSLAIRQNDVTRHVSQVCAYKDVREHMVTLQRKMGEIGNVVLDGRDIGTHVFPNADVKIFLNAPVKARALRRFLENKEKGINISYDDLVLDLERRDYADSTRAISPLKQAEDAVYLDNSNLNIEETAEKIIEIIKEKTGGK